MKDLHNPKLSCRFAEVLIKTRGKMKKLVLLLSLFIGASSLAQVKTMTQEEYEKIVEQEKDTIRDLIYLNDKYKGEYKQVGGDSVFVYDKYSIGSFLTVYRFKKEGLLRLNRHSFDKFEIVGEKGEFIEFIYSKCRYLYPKKELPFPIDIKSNGYYDPQQYIETNDFDLAQLSYYPNPTTDLLTISYKEPIVQVEVYDLSGRKVITKEFDSDTVELDLTNLSSRTYMLNVKTKYSSQFVKVVIK